MNLTQYVNCQLQQQSQSKGTNHCNINLFLMHVSANYTWDGIGIMHQLSKKKKKKRETPQKTKKKIKKNNLTVNT